MRLLYPLLLVPTVLCSSLESRKFTLESRATNIDGSLPTYKNPEASIEDRIGDLLPRMTLEEKVSQLIQGDINGWMPALDDPLDNTLSFNQSGLEEMMRLKGGSIWGGYLMTYEKFVFAVEVGQRYLMENTTLGIPALIQSEGLHGFTNNGTIFPSPIGLAASFNRDVVKSIASIVSDEAEGLGINHIFAPVLDLSRELRWGRVEENYGEDHFLTGELGFAFVSGIQDGTRRNVTAGRSGGLRKRMAATCKHFVAFGSPMTGLNLAPVVGGERDLRSTYLPPFERACLESLSMMTSYSAYNGIPTIADKNILTNILRDEWGYKYWVTCDAGSVDLLYKQHFTCETRECSAKATIENFSGEMGGGTYTYLTLPDQVKAGQLDEKYIDETVKYLLRVKFTLGLFENPYPYPDYLKTIRTSKSREALHTADLESIVLLENRKNTLPLSKDIKSIALIGPQADQVTFGDYVFFNATLNGITPLGGFKQFLSNSSSSTKINYAEGCKLWSNDESGFDEAVNAAQSSDVAIVMIGTWSRDQTLLWSGLNATTGEHVDVHDLGLVGAQLKLVQAVKATGKPTVVVFVSGKPIAEPWIHDHADAVIQQFYPGELGGLAIAEVIFGAYNPSGKLPVSFPRDVGTTPVFYNYLKGARPMTDFGTTTDNGTLVFGHQYVLESPIPLWSFGHGLSYTTFNYTDFTLNPSTIGPTDSFNVTVTVHNTGSVDGQEVVQVYATDVFSSVVTANQQLVGFEKVQIPAGSSRRVSILVDSPQLGLWSQDNKWVVEPGTFMIKIGTSDQTFAKTNLTVR